MIVERNATLFGYYKEFMVVLFERDHTQKI